jgi:hypothetical protein
LTPCWQENLNPDSAKTSRPPLSTKRSSSALSHFSWSTILCCLFWTQTRVQLEIHNEIHTRLLWGYCIRGKKPLLVTTLTAIAIVSFIVLPAIALSQLAISVRRERLLRPPQTTNTRADRLELQGSANQIARCESQHPCSGPSA